MPTELQAFRSAIDVTRWIAEARDGSSTAMDQLLGVCSPYLLAVANRELSAALRSRLDPGDVVQDTLLKAWRNFPHFRGQSEADLLAWLRQILCRNLADERRRHLWTEMRSIRREVALVEAVSMPQPDSAGSASESPGPPAQAREQYEELQGALRRLPENYRRVLQLHTQEGLTFAQVGGRLRCSAEAARKLWRRGAEKLAWLLRDARKS